MTTVAPQASPRLHPGQGARRPARARLAAAHPEKVLGLHLAFLPLRHQAAFPQTCTHEHRAYEEEVRFWRSEDAGYSAIQGTKPQTLSYALTDSPTGLAAWIVEKLCTWTDNNGDLERSLDLDSLLTTQRSTG